MTDGCSDAREKWENHCYKVVKRKGKHIWVMMA